MKQPGIALNAAQQKAVQHFRGPMMVLAGPGSGKTRVITQRVHFLISEKKVLPSAILVITFTKAAAAEMRQRYLSSDKAAPVQFGTFHAIFFMILKYAYHYTPQNIISDELRRQILQELVSRTELEIPDENEFLQELSSEISRVKGEQMALEHYYSPACPGDAFRTIYRGYQRELEKRCLLDFDDMLVYCYELLSQREDILAMWQKQYPFILVDEFQDVNRLQYEVLKLLAGKEKNVFVVGDDDQSIYGFRGARPDIMQHFVRDFQPERCVLNVNYRCGQTIVKASEALICHNRNRMPKEITAVPERDGADCQGHHGRGVVRIEEYEKSSEENDAIREQIMKYRKAGIPYREMAVLFRTNTQARGITAKLREYNIPFAMKEMTPNLYEHWIARDIFAYIRIAGGSRKRADVLRIINRPKRYVHRNAFTEPYVDFEELKLFYEDKDWMVERIEQLQEDCIRLAGMRPYAAVNFIRRGIQYDSYIREYAEYKGIPADDMYDILEELQEDAKAYQSFEAWFEAVQRYGEELKEQKEKSRRLRNGQGLQEDAVEIMTMHGAKGLEYDCVFLPDANEGVTPHNKAVLTEDLEEERRMFYVAMTRARKCLHISYLRERFGREAEVSRFVEEIRTGAD